MNVQNVSPQIFEKTFVRRALYKRAHSDPALAAAIMANDPLYGLRGKLTGFENTVNDVIVTISIVPLSLLEMTLGNLLDAVEKDPLKRSPVGRAYDALKYTLIDPFHRKRNLYTLPVDLSANK